MNLRTTTRRGATTRDRATRVRRSPIPADRRGGSLLGAAAAGALLVNVVIGAEPAAQAGAATESVSVADQLGLTSHHTTTDVTDEVAQLEDLAASRSSRAAAESAARQAQAAADRAELERQRSEAEAKARAEAKAAAEAAAKEAAAAAAAAEAQAAEVAPEGPAGSGTAVSAIARISNSLGPVRPQAQAAADAVVSNVPGAAGITIGGTRASAADPGGHPSGLALDYMVMSDAALGDAIVQYHIDNWDALGVDYLIWQQRYLGSPGGSWSYMEDRGSATANHMDHPHVNYRP